MKAKLIFDLPDEQDQFNNAVNGAAYASAVHEFSQWLRRRFKHEDPANEGVVAFYNEVWAKYLETHEGLLP